MSKRDTKPGDPIIIKKYANRRLYNTGTSSYITLDDLARMTREGVDFQVVDAKTGEDITHSILTQIIMDEEASGTQMLPVSFLRDLISMYGNSMQSLMPSYLEASMANFRKNREELQGAFREGLANNPLAKIAETNMAMMKAMGEAFLPNSRQRPQEPLAGQKPAQDDEIAALREQMAAMQKKLDELSK
ncbi:polyhydroxyalkanoate synthesis repressor PhaR [Altererythrobacter sp. H2]|uniref:polyhydroxyalkanoate synthesis repressor PhaR n=1 Tax=Altererythrobacter sp. H2 TaxID=3108391 RepID=UPI000BD8F73F|nr:polyhydroxyalkanoate synthesis repressor PhaR [Altererythrobacter sp. H2]OZA94322.1 MAG: polyhydroxyalkanoate synthesis repressor PhaR [Erythrobacter sp. 34-65-8]WRK97280.1 polyhydroxyalkanoate synthesis repressor PhaR [Altererythrobacter sp. H2]